MTTRILLACMAFPICGCDLIGYVEFEFLVTGYPTREPISDLPVSTALLAYTRIDLRDAGKTDENGRVEATHGVVLNPFTRRPTHLDILVELDDGTEERLYLLMWRRRAQSWDFRYRVELVSYDVHPGWPPQTNVTPVGMVAFLMPTCSARLAISAGMKASNTGGR